MATFTTNGPQWNQANTITTRNSEGERQCRLKILYFNCLPAELFVIQLILDTLLGIVTIIYPGFVMSVWCGAGYSGYNGHWCWHHAMWWVARHG